MQYYNIWNTDLNLINLSWIFVKMYSVDASESSTRTVMTVNGDSYVSLKVLENFFSSCLSKEPEKILPQAAAKRRDFSINSKAELWGNDNDSGERRGVHGTGLKITSHLWLLLVDVLRHNPRHPGVRLFIYSLSWPCSNTFCQTSSPGARSTSHIIYLQLATTPTLQINA